MPPRATGTVIRKKTRRGISYGLRVPFQGAKEYVTLGGSWEGWTEERVQAEREYIALQISRGEWVPPARTPAAATEGPASDDEMTLRAFASLVLARKRKRLSVKGYADLKWKLEVAVHYLGHLPLLSITEGTIEDLLVQPLLEERVEIEHARVEGAPLTQRVTDSRGRTYERRRRGLSRGSINKVLSGLNVVMKEARRRKLVEHNPVDQELRVKTKAAERSFLEVAQIDALLRGACLLEEEHRGLTWEKVNYIRASALSNVALARELRISDVTIGKVRRGLIWTDEAGPRNRNDIAREAVIATLVMAGLRVSERCGLQGRHMDFANARIQITRDITKTDAGVRTIPMVPALRAVLIAHSVERPYGPREHVFPTRKGTRNTPDNVRAHIIDTAHERADKLLGASGGVVIAHLTPHRSAARLHRSWRSSGCRRAVPCTSLAIPTRGSP